MARSKTDGPAPAGRASARALRAARAGFLADRTAVALLDGVPDPVLVLNRERQILACNSVGLAMLGRKTSEELLGLRPGEAAQCLHASEGPDGCGTGSGCEHCGAVWAVQEAMRVRAPVSRECRLAVGRGRQAAALDLLVRATLLQVGKSEVVMVTLRDISGDKRRRALEQVFFHDLANTAASIQSVAWLLNKAQQSPEEESDCRSGLWALAEQLADEITAQRQLLEAEEGTLQLRLEEVSLPDLLAKVAAAYRHHRLTRMRCLQVGQAPQVTIKTDSALLRRVLGNLVKNALEAVPEGETVTLSAEVSEPAITFLVKNPGTIPEAVQPQIFQRSFSTKEGPGRGLGTHSVRLLTERYLGGSVTFISTPTAGTTFMVKLPR